MAWTRVRGLRPLELGTPGGLRKKLTDLVLAGTKTGTAGLLSLDYEAEGGPVEHVGERLALVDEHDRAMAIVRVTAVDVVPFGRVTDDFARSEGEGFDDYALWAAAHRRYWEREVAVITDETPVVCLNFELTSEDPC
jgi:uncharacterized protein YhfF